MAKPNKDDITNIQFILKILKEFAKDSANEYPLQNEIFNKNLYSTSGYAYIPKRKVQYNTILNFISQIESIKPSQTDFTKEFNVYDIPYFGDLVKLLTADIDEQLRQLEGLDGDDFQVKQVEMVDTLFNEMQQKVFTTLEYMCSWALVGELRDKDENILHTYGTGFDLGEQEMNPATQAKLVVTNLIRKMIKKLEDETGYKGAVKIAMGSEAEDIITQTVQYETWVEKGVIDAVTASQGSGGMLGKDKYYRLADSYWDKGTKKSFFTPKKIMIYPAKTMTMFYKGLYVGDKKLPKKMHIDKKEFWNPDGTDFRLQATGLPVNLLADSTVSATLKFTV